MSRNKRFSKQNSRANTSAQASGEISSQAGTEASVQAFSFGDPEPVLDSRSLWDYLECGYNGQWYEPPVPFEGLARSFRANSHHETALRIKRNFLVRLFKPHALFNKTAFSAFELDYLVFGNAFIERRSSLTGCAVAFKHTPAKYTRRCLDLERYVFIQTGASGISMPYGRLAALELPVGEVFHLLEPDINQEVYGMPEYLSALQSLWLNELATLFRRKYYKNGSHAGFILYMNDEKMQKADVEAIRKAMRESKGPGNFKNLFVYVPGGNKEGVKMIPIGEVAAKDEFSNIKNVSRDDVLVAHRVPPQLLGVVPQNSGGFGSIKDATQAFLTNEVLPLAERVQEVNHWAGESLIEFNEIGVILDQLGATSMSASHAIKQAAAAIAAS